MALALSAVSYSYCYSETVYGVTNNAATGGNTWGMTGVLPDYSAPNVSLQVNGVVYQYTAVKDPATGMIVHVRNEDLVNGGYVFNETDDWSGLPGNTIRKFFNFPGIPAEQWGDGEIAIEGQGTVENASVVYTYRMDIGPEALNCLNPLSDPSCPGFAAALREYLKGIENLGKDDPFYDEWVQAQLQRETELEEENEVVASEENEEEDLENQLGAENTMDDLIGADQAAMIQALNNVPKIDTYYALNIPGGVYQDTMVLQDAELPDNRRALSNLARDEVHRSMVRSQYDR